MNHHQDTTKNRVYTCPMHPSVERNRPGNCPQCGMALVPQAESSHGDHEQHDVSFRRKFWASVALTVPIILFSQTIQTWFGYSLSFVGSNFIPAIFGLILFSYGGWVFLASAYRELRGRQPGMMTLIAMAISVAFLYSLAVTLQLVRGMDFWWELATLIDIMLLGHWVEMVAIQRSGSALKELAALLPDEVELVEGDMTKRVPRDQVATGMVVRIRPGGSIPTDGVIMAGETEVNEAMLTGESRPVARKKGDEVIAGTVNVGGGALTVRVTKTGESTVLAGIMKLVEDAQANKGRVQLLADKVASYLTAIAIGMALLTLVGWTLVGGQSMDFVLERVVTVLIIACPHALGLAIPLVVAIVTSRAAKQGFLIRDRSAFELAFRANVVLFDKTGTLTTGEQSVDTVLGDNPHHVLSVAASVEEMSEHMIGRAIVTQAKKTKLTYAPVTHFAAEKGKGVAGKVGGRRVVVGTKAFLEQHGISVAKDAAYDKALQDAKTVVYVAENTVMIGAIVIADSVRKEARRAVESLHAMGVEVAMVTGDATEVAASVSSQLGIDTYYAEILPAGKVTLVEKLQAAGKRVVMVGDGVNDAPALVQANVGIAIGAGTDVAIEAADIVLATSDPQNVSKVLTLSRVTYRKMRQNLVWALGYNAITLPLATGITAGVGFLLSPAVGAVLMSLSTIVVALNAQLLRRVRL